MSNTSQAPCFSIGAIARRKRMRRALAGELKAFADRPGYLPKLFL